MTEVKCMQMAIKSIESLKLPLNLLITFLSSLVPPLPPSSTHIPMTLSPSTVSGT